MIILIILTPSTEFMFKLQDLPENHFDERSLMASYYYYYY